MDNKQAIRKRIKAEKKSAVNLERQSGFLMDALERHPRFEAASTVLMYWSLPDEPDTHAFVAKWSRRKDILLPVVAGDDLLLKHYVSQKNLAEGAWGIMEPEGTPFVDFPKIDLAVIPGVAFDRNGNRLGRGKGFYDRFLSKAGTAHIYKIGICFRFQIIDSLPVSEWDIPMDEVLYEY